MAVLTQSTNIGDLVVSENIYGNILKVYSVEATSSLNVPTISATTINATGTITAANIVATSSMKINNDNDVTHSEFDPYKFQVMTEEEVLALIR